MRSLVHFLLLRVLDLLVCRSSSASGDLDLLCEIFNPPLEYHICFLESPFSALLWKVRLSQGPSLLHRWISLVNLHLDPILALLFNSADTNSFQPMISLATLSSLFCLYVYSAHAHCGNYEIKDDHLCLSLCPFSRYAHLSFSTTSTWSNTELLHSLGPCCCLFLCSNFTTNADPSSSSFLVIPLTMQTLNLLFVVSPPNIFSPLPFCRLQATVFFPSPPNISCVVFIVGVDLDNAYSFGERLFFQSATSSRLVLWCLSSLQICSPSSYTISQNVSCLVWSLPLVSFFSSPWLEHALFHPRGNPYQSQLQDEDECFPFRRMIPIWISNNHLHNLL